MKLSKRARQARALLILAGLLITGYGVNFYATHHRVYGNCHTTVDGKECDLIRWEDNK